MGNESSSRHSLDRIRYSLTRMSIDALVVGFAYSIVYLVNPVRVFEDPAQNTWFIVMVAVLLVMSLYGFGVYRRIWERTSGYGISILINATALTTVLLIIFTIVINPRPLSLATVLFGNLLSLVGFVGIRYRSRLISGFAWRWKAWLNKTNDLRERVLIVGAGEAGQAVALSLKHRSASRRYNLIGFIDDDESKQNMFVEGSPVLGMRGHIQTIVQREDIELIVVAIHNIAGAAFREILNQCELTNARIKVVPDIISQFKTTHHSTLLRDVRPEDLLGRGVIERHQNVDLTPLLHKVIVVTGAAGSIGSELSRQILDYGPTRVILIDNNESGLYDLQVDIEARNTGIEVIVHLADITHSDQIKRVFEIYRPQLVFHAAAYKHVPMLEHYPTEALRVNIQGTMNVAQVAMRYQVERFVLISTDKAVNPSSVMGASKRICELLLHSLMQQSDCRTLFTSVRFGNVLGSRGSVVPTFTQQIERGGPVTVTHEEMTRYFMTIPEAVNLIIHAAALTQGDDIFILQMGEVVRIVDLAERLIRLRGMRPYIDIPVTFTGIREGEKMHEELYTAAEQPEATKHPFIIKINTWSETFDHQQFDQSVTTLLSLKTASHTDIMTTMRDIMQPALPIPTQVIITPQEAH